MLTLKFYIVDVFAQQKYSGNQLAVFFDLEEQLSSAQMLAITKEINFAESTFIRSIEDDGSYGVRIFTTEYEVPFAGHPSLGTAYIIAKYIDQSAKNTIVLRVKQGDIPVAISNVSALNESRFTMQQTQPSFGNTYSAEKLANACDIPVDKLVVSMPIEEVNTGLPYLIIFLKDLQSIQNLQLNDAKVSTFLRQEQLHKDNNARALTTSLFFVTQETEEKHTDFHARMFALEDDKIWEDAATGSANGCFLAYLLKQQHTKQSVVVEQGYEMGRKSILYLDGERNETLYTLHVGGQVVPVSEGLWHV